MAFPVSQLTPVVICGFVSDSCGEPLNGTVAITLLNPDGDPVCDQSNGAIISEKIPNIKFEDGCWCTCPLLPNSAADASQALSPNNTSYQIVVTAANEELVNEIVHLNVEQIADLPTTQAECGECINIKEFMNLAPGGTPPPDTFCDAVAACLAVLVPECVPADLAAAVPA